MKKNELTFSLWRRLKQKLLLKMKLTVLILLGFMMQVSASVYSQTAKLSLDLQDKRISEVLKEIEESTNYRFFYQREQVDVDRIVNMQVKNQSVDEILSHLFKDQNVTYKIMDDNLILITSGEVGVQQQRNIKGVVKNADGESVPGVTVIVKGTTNGTITDVDGNYTLTKVPSDATLIFSFVGMRTQEVPISGKTTINVMMEDETIGLDEVVAIGYGTVKKSDLTGSVSSMKKEDLNTESNTSIGEMLQGRSAGVQVIQSDAEPGGGVAIRIRGAGSINAGSGPLYVIDGLPVDNSLVVDGSGAGVVGTRSPRNPLSSINPSDIESIEVLKDASATAIYGARGANGVIIVTTKKGKQGKLRVNYSGYMGVQSPSKLIDLLTPEEYQKVLNEIITDGGGNPEEKVNEIVDGGIDWQKKITRDAMINSHGLSFSGGSNKTNYYASLNYFDQEGIVINSAFKRYDARLNLNQKTEKFYFGLNFTTSYTHDNFVSHGYGINENAGTFYAALNFDPTIAPYNADGSYTQSSFISIDNPLALANEETSFGNNYRTMGTVFGEYTILKGLTTKLNLGVDVQNSRKDSYVGIQTLDGAGTGGMGTILTGTRTNYLMEWTATYMKDFNEKHSLTVMGGVTYQKFLLDRFTGRGSNFSTQTTKTFSMQSADPTQYTMDSFRGQNQLESYFGRVNYSYLNKYLFTASFRMDGSSRFGENNKYGYFPSGAFAWKMHEEDFVKNLNLFSLLKFRASWGRTGNQEIGNYQSQTTFATGPTAIMDGVKVSTLDPSRIGNPDLKWETTEQTNFGFDMGFVKNRIYASMDYYQKNTSDMLIYLPVPASSGFGSILQNIGSIKNTGFEFMIDSKNLVGKFKWNTTLNFSTLHNEVTDIGAIPEIIHTDAGWSQSIALIRVGETLNSFYGYKILGVWQEGDDFSVTTDPVAPGDTKYQDTNGDKTVNADDRVILGNSFPDFTWGMSNNFKYKGFTISVFLEGVHGLSMLNNNLVDSYFPINFRRNKFAEPYLNRWTSSNPSNKYPSFVNPNGQGNKAVNSYTVEDASYIRLKTIKLSYDVALKNTKVFKNASVYVTAQNIATFTKYSGFDPATNSNGNPSLKIDYDSYPMARSILLGVELGF